MDHHPNVSIYGQMRQIDHHQHEVASLLSCRHQRHYNSDIFAYIYTVYKRRGRIFMITKF